MSHLLGTHAEYVGRGGIVVADLILLGSERTEFDADRLNPQAVPECGAAPRTVSWRCGTPWASLSSNGRRPTRNPRGLRHERTELRSAGAGIDGPRRARVLEQVQHPERQHCDRRLAVGHEGTDPGQQPTSDDGLAE
ncbi:hypothetical protein D9M68_747870 [compost metagenome]